MPTIEVRAELAHYRLPGAVQAPLQYLVDLQDAAEPPTAEECREAEGLVALSELLSLLSLRTDRATLMF